MSFLRHGEIYHFDEGATPLDRAPAHRNDEFPAGYSLAGCAPAEPASASPAGSHLAGKPVRGTIRFQRTAGSVLTVCLTPGDKRNGWFNTSCFAVPPNGRFGNSGVNILEGPGLNNQSVSLSKSWPVTERWHIEFSAMASNVFNHPNFYNPGSNDITVPGAGVIDYSPDYYSAVKAGPRIIEGRLRILW